MPAPVEAHTELVHLGPVTLERTYAVLLERTIAVCVTLLVAGILLRLVPLLERAVIRFATRHGGESATSSMIDQQQRVETLARVTSSVARAAIVGATIVTALGDVGIAIGPLIAGAGVAGVAVGFGAQSIVKDFFAGFFILLENQYDVGDTVTVAGVTGTVERMTMRITLVRDANGTAHFIPNSNITNVANKTYGWGRALLDVTFAPTVSEADARAVLTAAAARAAAAPELAATLLEPIAVDGPLDFNTAGVTWRVHAKTHANRAADARRLLVAALVTELNASGFATAAGVVARSTQDDSHKRASSPA